MEEGRSNMERILTCISYKEILILFLLVPLVLTGMLNLTQQSKASDNNSNKIFHANGLTADINTKNNLAKSTKVTKVIGNNQI